MKYLWDRRKAAVNRRKHDVSFNDAKEAVADPGRLEFFDDRFPYGEERFQIIGRSLRGVLFVVVIEDETKCRIISARKATRLEEQDYYAQGG